MSLLIMGPATFPAWRHSALGESKIVHTQEQCDALGNEWADSPMAFEQDIEPTPEVDQEQPKARSKPGRKPKAKE